ncbi:MAG: hypothetical protein AMXMBFR13_36940 [Phycisphaerae bacterium]
MATAIAILAGCDKPNTGPKRADHAAAHTARYHPDVQRRAATRPADEGESTTKPADFQFGANPVGSPIMFVNGEAVAVQDILEPLIEDLSEKARTLSEEGYRNYLISKVVEQISIEISRILVAQQAKEDFPDKLNELLEKEADRMITDVVNARFGGVHARYEAHLKAMDLTVKEMKERAKRQAMVTEFLHKRFKPMIQNPPRAELYRYYQQHLDDFTTPERAELLLIEIPLAAQLGKPLSAASSQEIAGAREEARQRLQRALQELESGIPFGDVARQYSKGLQASRGGEWGDIGPGALTGRWAKAGEVLFTLEEGQTSEIIDTPEALFIVRAGRKTPAQRTSFEESQKQIIEKLLGEQFNELQFQYVRELESKATIRRRSEFTYAVLSAAPRPARYAEAGASARE